MFATMPIPADTLAAHSPNALAFYNPRFRGRGAPARAARAALAFAVLSSKSDAVTASERMTAAIELVGLGATFAVRLAGHTMGVSSHEIVVGSSENTVTILCDTSSTMRPVYTNGRCRTDAVFQLDKRTKRVETWTFKSSDRVTLAHITIDEQRA